MTRAAPRAGARRWLGAALWLAALGLSACDIPPPPGSRSRESAAAPREDAGSGGKHSAGRSGLASIEGEDEARQIYYQFVDARGAVRFVPTLDAVPAEWRSRVGFVEMSSPPPLTPADAQRIRDRRTAHLERGADATAAAEADLDTAGGDAASPGVVLYGAEWCPACRRAKQYLEERGVAYTERNVDEARWHDEMVAKAGPGGIPVIDVGGQILRGFNPQRLDAMLRGS